MSASSGLLKSSLVKKYWMGATGLFLCTFLIGHLAGNLQLMLSPDVAKDQFNEYALFMTTNPAVKVLSWLTYISILFHAIDGIVLTVQNKKARGQKYAYNKAGASSSWASRKMTLLGLITLWFIVGHMAMFWFQMHFGDLPKYTTAGGAEVTDLYTVVKTFFSNSPDGGGIGAVIFYTVCMVALGFHLSHGFQSGFQSLGLRHPKYTPIIKKVGLGFSVVICGLFAIIPIYMYFVL